MAFRRCYFAALAISSTLPSVFGGQVQLQGLTLPPGPSAEQHREAVQEIFTDSYEAYRKYAFGHDDLSPISMTFSDGLNGFGASIVDAMSTMLVMGLDDFFTEAVDFVSTINYNVSKTSDHVSVFETTIRHIGGLLSAFELSDENHPILVQKAKEVADKLAFGFVDGNVIPFGHLDFSTNIPLNATSNIAEAGTLALEWSRLSTYTNNATYGELAVNALKHIATNPSPMPGFPAQGIDPNTGKPVGALVTWGGGSDSYLEYLIKFARLSNTDDPTFADSWATAVDSSIKNLLRTSTVGNNLFMADSNGGTISHVGSHLACFYGGNWLLGGKLLNNQTIVDFGLRLTDACWNTYASTATGIGPEVFQYESADGGGPPPADQLVFNSEHGFWINSADYILRPEVLESNFYAWRVTGDTKYLDRAASAIESFNTYLPAGVAFAGINDVNNKQSSKIDDTESFWFAEVLKYLYLTFDDPDHISLDDFVFNTECHPLKAPQLGSYGSGNMVSHKPSTGVTSGPLPAVSPSVNSPQGVTIPLHI